MKPPSTNLFLPIAAAGATRFGGFPEYREGRYGESYRHTGFRGRGPKGYKRADERIREDICERLTENDDVDASNIEVSVAEGVVSLSGSVDDRWSKRIAEDIAQEVWGAKDVQNHIKVQESRGILENTGDTQTGTGTQGSVGGQSGLGQQSSSSGILGLNTETAKR